MQYYSVIDGYPSDQYSNDLQLHCLGALTFLDLEKMEDLISKIDKKITLRKWGDLTKCNEKNKKELQKYHTKFKESLIDLLKISDAKIMYFYVSGADIRKAENAILNLSDVFVMYILSVHHITDYFATPTNPPNFTEN